MPPWQAAIKRLKEECEHQLQLERSRYDELARQKKGEHHQAGRANAWWRERSFPGRSALQIMPLSDQKACLHEVMVAPAFAIFAIIQSGRRRQSSLNILLRWSEDLRTEEFKITRTYRHGSYFKQEPALSQV